MKTTATLPIALAAIACIAFSSAESRADNRVPATAGPSEQAKAEQPLPVDDSMHHLMEYVFEPAYKRLKISLASEPAGKQDWKPVKADSLTLAEACNLLLHRAPPEATAGWLKLATETRKAGAAFYQAARAGDYAAASEAYRSTLQRCNACHDEFADGKFQLKP